MPPFPISANCPAGELSRNLFCFSALWAAWAETGFGVKCVSRAALAALAPNRQGYSGGSLMLASFDANALERGNWTTGV